LVDRNKLGPIAGTFQFSFYTGPIQFVNWPQRAKGWIFSGMASVGSHNTKETVMPLVDIQLIKGVFTPEQKKSMISKVTDAMVAVEGEPMRQVTWVRIQEIESGQWAIGGNPLTADAVKAMAAG
jgi:4-oxalocrotonate tautomerase